MTSMVIIPSVKHISSNILIESDDDGRPCTQPGPMCDSCDTVVTCIRDDDGFHKLPLETCSSGESCLRAACTTEKNPQCEEELPFPCNDIGVFPNPYLCQIYHFCIPSQLDGSLISHRIQCDGNFGYHAGTTFCQTRLDNYVCSDDKFPVDLCRNLGQNGALAENESIYYICAPFDATNEVLYPFLFVCPHGGSYWDYECHLDFEKNLSKLMKRF
ncbi:chitin binding peritrophin-a [Holotrichia oblita]|uniref:Chitin binding peritrophin-a n=1 Tax=Holotrichia oblita TaxID=644536 RepID=A0ACB9SIW2_HOLOL|nr:chitin binding peritrophin-a [Holotrichia oblita]